MMVARAGAGEKWGDVGQKGTKVQLFVINTFWRFNIQHGD